MSSEQMLQELYQAKEAYYFHGERHEMLPFIPLQSSMILEIGCGYGNFGKLLKERSPVQVWGIEIEEQAAAIANQKLDKVICSAFSRELNLPEKSFDCIIFNDVLEHLVDPFEALLYCKNLLRVDGIVVASIPNVRFFYNMISLVLDGDWEYADDGILDRTHLRFFTYRSILNMFERLGYSVESIQGLNSIAQLSFPGRLRYFNGLLKLFSHKVEDMRHLQFGVVAKPK
ncbi:MAG: class I SAM-dependent methyltransferase [Cyanobacteria bacterium CAN_BIN43]|nr:class I SAM-dependent methyltransferase [Cyanobacteria bacterium CAN_BIN43]